MLARGKFGIEYNPKPLDDDSSGVGWIVLVVVAVAAVSLAWTLFSRFRARPNDDGIVEPPKPPAVVETPKTPPKAESTPVAQQAQTNAPPKPIVPPVETGMAKRPAKVRHLLMRLEEADKKSDIEMAVTTIEQLRSLPGAPAADLDNKLARRLGELNVKRLFEQRNAQWVAKVVVKRGDSTSRIASEHGSTLASLKKLNEGTDVNRVRIGQTLYVMNHPRFNLVVHRRTRTADLQLNGKFFKRYDMTSETAVKEGAYEWRGVNLELKPADRTELDTLLPKSASVLVSEM